jgi:hypothetical protein
VQAQLAVQAQAQALVLVLASFVVQVRAQVQAFERLRFAPEESCRHVPSFPHLH